MPTDHSHDAFTDLFRQVDEISQYVSTLTSYFAKPATLLKIKAEALIRILVFTLVTSVAFFSTSLLYAYAQVWINAFVTLCGSIAFGMISKIVAETIKRLLFKIRDELYG